MAGEILIMIPQYGELNRIYSDFIVSHTFSFDKQKFITNFYKQYNDTKAFEAATPPKTVVVAPNMPYAIAPIVAIINPPAASPIMAPKIISPTKSQPLFPLE